MKIFNLKKSSRKKILLGTILVAMIFMFFAAPVAQAAVLDKVVEYTTIRPGVAFIYGISSQLLASSGLFLNWTIRLDADPTNTPVVAEVWKIMRDFANMFFIIGLVVMAFATIFDLDFLSLGAYNWKAGLARLIVMAIMLNFSLVIGGIIIQMSQVVSNVFVMSIGDAGTRVLQSINTAGSASQGGTWESIWASVGNMAAALAGPGTVADALKGYFSGASLGQMLINSIIFLMLAGSMFVSALTMLIRIPVLWMLLIISPLAWMTNIFPSMNGGWKKWWDQFIGWNVFLPIKLFFMYIGFYILARQGEILNGIWPQSAGLQQPLLGLGISVQEMFVYGLIIYMFLAGTKYARSASISAGARSVDAPIGNWMVNRWGVKQAVVSTYKEAREQGVSIGGRKIYGGEEATRQRAAGWETKFGSMLGHRGAEFKGQEQFRTQAMKEYESLNAKLENGTLNRADLERDLKKYSVNDPKGYAYRRLMAEKGLTPGAESFEETLDKLKGNAVVIKDFSERSAEGGFKNTSDDALLEIFRAKGKYAKYNSSEYTTTHLSIAKKLSASEFSVGKLKGPDIERLVALGGGPNSKASKEMLDNIKKYNPVAYSRYITAETDSGGGPLSKDAIDERNPIKDDGRDTLEKSLTKAMNVSPKQLGAMNVDSWRDPLFKEIFMRDLTDTSISLKDRKRYISQIAEEISDHPAGKEEKQKLFKKWREETKGRVDKEGLSMDISESAIDAHDRGEKVEGKKETPRRRAGFMSKF